MMLFVFPSYYTLETQPGPQLSGHWCGDDGTKSASACGGPTGLELIAGEELQVCWFAGRQQVCQSHTWRL